MTPMATTMQPGAPGYEKHMAHMQEAQQIGPPRHPPPSQIPEGALGGGGQVTPPSGGKGGTPGTTPITPGTTPTTPGTTPITPGTTPTTPGTTGGAGDDFLSRFGYQGRVGVNPMEQLGLGLTAGMAGQQRPMQTTLPAQQALASIVGGEFAPQGQKFRGDVYEATKTGAMQNLADLQKQMGESFAHRGGYFGGQHALAQAKLAERTASPLNQLLGGLNLQGFQGDIANRLTAAGGLGGLAGTQRGIESSLLGDVMGGGQMLTERELQNRQLYQGASDRAYQDWLRARQETMMPFNMISPLLGAQTTQPLLTQGQSPWSGIASLLGPALGAAITRSSEKFKKDIHLLDENDESKIFEEMANVPIFKYKYKADPEEKERIGLISEKAPKEISFLKDSFVGLYEYIGMLHATVKELSRKVQKLEDK